MSDVGYWMQIALKQKQNENYKYYRDQIKFPLLNYSLDLFGNGVFGMFTYFVLSKEL